MVRRSLVCCPFAQAFGREIPVIIPPVAFGVGARKWLQEELAVELGVVFESELETAAPRTTKKRFREVSIKVEQEETPPKKIKVEPEETPPKKLIKVEPLPEEPAPRFFTPHTPKSNWPHCFTPRTPEYDWWRKGVLRLEHERRLLKAAPPQEPLESAQQEEESESENPFKKVVNPFKKVEKVALIKHGKMRWRKGHKKLEEEQNEVALIKQMEQHEIEKVALIKKLEEEQTEVALMEQNEVALIKKLAEKQN